MNFPNTQQCDMDMWTSDEEYWQYLLLEAEKHAQYIAELYHYYYPTKELLP